MKRSTAVMLAGSLFLAASLPLFFFIESVGIPVAVMLLGFALIAVGWRDADLW
jgi:hypothetical protein